MSDRSKHYQYEYKGIKLDPARVGRVWNITDPLQLQALKKIAFPGQRGHKSKKDDLLDVIACCQRIIEMDEEDALSDGFVGMDKANGDDESAVTVLSDDGWIENTGVAPSFEKVNVVLL